MRIVQARIDEKTEALLVRLRRQTGMNDSELVRKGLELVSQTLPARPRRRIRGLGAFSSGHRDLGSKRHLAGFGQK